MVFPSTQEMVGGGLLCLVMHDTVSTLSSVTVRDPFSIRDVFDDSIEMEEGGTKEDILIYTDDDAKTTYPEH